MFHHDICKTFMLLRFLVTVNLEIFARVLFSRNFAYAKFRENKPSRNGEITMSFTNIGKSCPTCEFISSQICLLMLFAKIKCSRKFPDLQYTCTSRLHHLHPHTLVIPVYFVNWASIHKINVSPRIPCTGDSILCRSSNIINQDLSLVRNTCLSRVRWKFCSSFTIMKQNSLSSPDRPKLPTALCKIRTQGYKFQLLI